MGLALLQEEEETRKLETRSLPWEDPAGRLPSASQQERALARTRPGWHPDLIPPASRIGRISVKPLILWYFVVVAPAD